MDILDDYKFTKDKISITIEKQEDKIILLFNGVIDMSDPVKEIFPFIENIHDYLIKKKIKLIELNFHDLGFMNSSGIKLLIKWIILNTTLSEDNIYMFRIITNHKIHWQKPSIETLKYIAPNTVDVIVD